MDKEDRVKFFKTYLREYDVRFSEEDEKYFDGLEIKTENSYVVTCSDFSRLKKFVNCFLLANELFDHVTYDINEYINFYVSPQKDIVYNELLIIHYPVNAFEYGKTKELIQNALLQTITSRNRMGFTTIVLAEKPLPYLEECKDIEKVTLSVGSNQPNTNSKANSKGVIY